MGDVVAGGTVFWLSDAVDAGEIAAQHWCWIRPDDTAETLWRRELAPMGVRLLQRVLQDVDRGVLIRVPQDPTLATWEPSWERPPLHRPDLPLLGDGRVEPFTVLRDRAALDPR
jgi:methionyl-tRNA formyltransferase